MKQTDIEMSYAKLKESDDRLKILKTETGKERSTVNVLMSTG